MLAAGLCHAVTAKATLTIAATVADGNWSLSRITIPGIQGDLVQANTLLKAEATGLGWSNIGVASYDSGINSENIGPEPTTAVIGALLLLPLAAVLHKTRRHKPV
jgi:hypothetical protein